MSVPIQKVTFERTVPPTLGPCGGAEHLRWLIRQIADDNRNAFAELFDHVSGPVSRWLHSQLSDPVRAAGIIAGTFVEVWWLAGGHVAADTDVLAWINEVVRRRLADSRPLGPSRSPEPRATDPAALTPSTLTALWTQHVELELAGLLRRAPTPHCAPCVCACSARAHHHILRPKGNHDYRFR